MEVSSQLFEEINLVKNIRYVEAHRWRLALKKSDHEAILNINAFLRRLCLLPR